MSLAMLSLSRTDCAACGLSLEGGSPGYFIGANRCRESSKHNLAFDQINSAVERARCATVY